jgi:anti-sigma factor RsiW
MEHVDELLSDYLDGELSHEATERIQEHLAACRACAERCRSLRRTVRFIQGNAATEVAPQTAAGAQARFIATVMRPESTDADIARVLLEETQRVFGAGPSGGTR